MLKLTDVNAYYGYVHALKGITLSVPRGKIVTLLGANGAGKTSILKAISGILEVRDGHITFEEAHLTSVRPEHIVARGIVQSPEGRQIFPELSVGENLMIGAYTRTDKKDIKTTLEKVFGYFPRLKEREKQTAGTLSGGEQQMLAIGRALMAKPKLLLLDEPSLGLAPLIVKDIFHIIQEINKSGTTILLVEQNAYQALAIADYGYILETGKIVHRGPSNELRNDEKVKQAYLGSL